MIFLYLSILIIFIFILGIKIVKPSERGLIEKNNKFHKFVKNGFHWVNPIFESLYLVTISEQMVKTLPQYIITEDNIKIVIDAQIYFKVKADEKNVINIIYNFENYKMCIINYARVSLRNLIGTITCEFAHNNSKKINTALFNQLQKKTKSRGIEIIRTELIKADKIV